MAFLGFLNGVFGVSEWRAPFGAIDTQRVTGGVLLYTIYTLYK